MSTDKQLQPNANDAGISERRRQMLRAAATSAPLVATLPSGAAWANASAFQCQTKDKIATDDTTGLPNDPPPRNVDTPGHWLTVGAVLRSGTREEVKGNGDLQPSKQESVIIYEITNDTAKEYYEYVTSADSPDDQEQPARKLDNPTINPTIDAETGNYIGNKNDTIYLLDAGTPVQVLRFFRVGDAMKAPSHCDSSPIALDADDEFKDAPPLCVYPVVTPADDTTLTALNNSCMVSVIVYTTNHA